MSGREALAWAANCQFSHLGIWQPDLNTTMDFSEGFLLAPRVMEDFIMAQDEKARSEVKTDWAIGVGVGVGVGVPLLMAAAWYVGYRTKGSQDRFLKSKR
jgi:hypothetical protein